MADPVTVNYKYWSDQTRLGQVTKEKQKERQKTKKKKKKRRGKEEVNYLKDMIDFYNYTSILKFT